MALEEAQAKLSMLSRSHPSEELERLSEELSELSRRRDMAHLRCSRASSDLREALWEHLTGGWKQGLAPVSNVSITLSS